MMKKTRQLVTTLFLAAAIVGTGAVYAHADAILAEASVTQSLKQNYTLKREDGRVKYEDIRDDFDLEVIAGRSIKNSELKWEIKNPKIVSFATKTKTGREVEFYAKKIGKTKVTCSYTNSDGETKSVTYVVNVVADDD